MKLQLPVQLLRYIFTTNVHVNTLIVYRKGDIVKQPMKKGSFVPKNVPGVGWGVGWGVVGHVGVGWVMQGWGGVVHAGVGWGGWFMQGWGGWVMQG